MDVDLAIWNRSLPYLLVLFAPVYIGAYRRWKNRHASWPAWGLFLMVYFTGWTVIGWLVALRMAFRDKSMPDWLTTSSGTGGGGAIPKAPETWQPPEPTTCMSCGGTGSHSCTWCQGRGQWYDASGPGHCQYCVSSGKIQCTNCRGTGKVG